MITEFVAGYLFPGRPIANIVFKVSFLRSSATAHPNDPRQVFGYMTIVQSLDLTSDMKLGLYMKIPPRHLFVCQVYGTALGSVVNYSRAFLLLFAEQTNAHSHSDPWGHQQQATLP